MLFYWYKEENLLSSKCLYPSKRHPTHEKPDHSPAYQDFQLLILLPFPPFPGSFHLMNFMPIHQPQPYTTILSILSENSDLPLRDHLLTEIILVLADRTVPPSNRLVLADHDVLGDFVQQSVSD